MPVRGDGSFSIGSGTWPGVSKLVEECGELGQVLGKLIATSGDPAHWDGTDLMARLHDELADVQAAIWFLEEANGLDGGAIEGRAHLKVTAFREWHAEHRG